MRGDRRGSYDISWNTCFRCDACNSLPFGTLVYIEDVGFRTVEDRGPAWLGSEWCDLYLGEYTDCVQWGDQTRKVWRVTE